MMITRRKILSLSLTSLLPISLLASSRGETKHYYLSQIAKKLWSEKSEHFRRSLSAKRALNNAEIGQLIEKKENEVANLFLKGNQDPLTAYAELSAHDFRQGKTMVIGGVTFSEIETALLHINS